MINALFLDLDNTLLDGSLFPQSVVKTCERVAEKATGLEPARLLKANTLIWQHLWPEIVDDWTLGRLSGSSLSLEVWRRTLHACGWHDEFLVHFASRKHLALSRETYRLFNDVEGLLNLVDQAGIPLALITNGASDTQHDKLRVLGIAERFDSLIVSGEIHAAKPLPEAFAPALEELGISGKSVWHVGDSLENDVAGANAAGLTSVWLNRNGDARQADDPAPDMEIQSLVELVEYFPAG